MLVEHARGGQDARVLPPGNDPQGRLERNQIKTPGDAESGQRSKEENGSRSQERENTKNGSQGTKGNQAEIDAAAAHPCRENAPDAHPRTKERQHLASLAGRAHPIREKFTTGLRQRQHDDAANEVEHALAKRGAPER